MSERRQKLESMPEIRPFLVDSVRQTGKRLGVGSYGSVVELEVSGLACAGKKIHEVLIDVGTQSVARKYVEECKLMSSLRHPNIVQFLGLCFLEDSSLPVLVMEKLVTNLDAALENSPCIPLGLKRSILADVARGLVYLHEHKPYPIVHRDLSAKNVLLDFGMVAKISDLGNSRIVGLNPDQLARTLSRAPGTPVYMPPEALDDTSRYGPSLDIFSFGHLALFTLTQIFPGNLLSHTYPDPQNRKRVIGRSEIERREAYFTHLYQQLGERHPLTQLVKQCLDNRPECRPSAKDLLLQLEVLKLEDPYQHLTRLNMIQLLQQCVDPQSEEIQRLHSQLKQMEVDMQAKDDVIQRMTIEVESLQKEIRRKDHLLHQTVSTIQSEGAEAVASPKDTQLTVHTGMRFTQCNPLPVSMQDAQALIHHEMLYVRGVCTPTRDSEFTICIYNFKPDTWDTIRTPTRFYAMTIYQGQLVLAGGCILSSPHTPTEKLWLASTQQCIFQQTVPPMRIATFGATAIATDNHLIIAGGENGSSFLDAVQVYSDRQWALAQSLPKPSSYIKHTCLNDVCYLIGGRNQGKQVVCASLPALIQSAHQHFKWLRTSPWKTLPEAPFKYSSIAILGSDLVAIGGGHDSSPSPFLYVFSQRTDSWNKIDATLPQPIYSTCSITIPTGELMVIGGRAIDGTTLQVYKLTAKE